MSREEEAHDRAAEWIIRQEETKWSDNDQAEFDAWLQSSDGNKAAYWRLKHSWKKADKIKALGIYPSLAPAIAPSSSTGQHPRPVYKWRGAVAAACLVIVTSSALYIGLPFSSQKTPSPATRAEDAVTEMRFQTPLGGHKRLYLADGSIVELNTASAVRIAMSGKERKVWLERGEAYFEVAPNRNRPFTIQNGNHVVTVLGTRFAVRQEDNRKTIISVVSGRVRLAETGAGRDNQLAILAGGDIATASGNSALVTAHDIRELEAMLSWRSGRLTFDGMSLKEAAAEFNRYNRKHIIISDPDIAAMRIGGSFPPTEPDAFIRLMKEAYGLKAQVDGDIVKISR